MKQMNSKKLFISTILLLLFIGFEADLINQAIAVIPEKGKGNAIVMYIGIHFVLFFAFSILFLSYLGLRAGYRNWIEWISTE